MSYGIGEKIFLSENIVRPFDTKRTDPDYGLHEAASSKVTRWVKIDFDFSTIAIDSCGFSHQHYHRAIALTQVSDQYDNGIWTPSWNGTTWVKIDDQAPRPICFGGKDHIKGALVSLLDPWINIDAKANASLDFSPLR